VHGCPSTVIKASLKGLKNREIPKTKAPRAVIMEELMRKARENSGGKEAADLGHHNVYGEFKVV
jgi:hypothetical protein